MEMIASEIARPAFWLAAVQIMGINILLSGDNAVVIALAARSLPPAQQKRAVAWGSGAAVVMRIVLTIVAVELLRLPYLKLVGGALLLWIGIKLVTEEEGSAEVKAHVTLWAAITTIVVADAVMSLDNAIAIAAAWASLHDASTRPRTNASICARSSAWPSRLQRMISCASMGVCQ